jgi:hypothetical protein
MVLGLRENPIDIISLESLIHGDPKYMLTFPSGSGSLELCAIEFLPFWGDLSENGQVVT